MRLNATPKEHAARQHRFSNTGNVLDQQVALAQQAYDSKLDNLPLANDDVFNVGDQFFGKGGGVRHWLEILTYRCRTISRRSVI